MAFVDTANEVMQTGLKSQVGLLQSRQLFQVRGQMANLKWSRGPDNVTHVNEG